MVAGLYDVAPSASSAGYDDADPGRTRTTLVGLGTAVTPRTYTQGELLDYFGITDRRVRLLFNNSAIECRHLTLPPLDADGRPQQESQSDLLRKHATVGVRIGAEAVRTCLTDAGLQLSDIDYLCCVTTTGMLAPSLSALLTAELGIDPNVGRLDVVGMGCSAGMSALRAVAGWSAGNPGKLAMMVCVEVCSAIYVVNDSIATAVVNSIFGDGAAATAIITPSTAAQAFEPPERTSTAPQLLRFTGTVLPEFSDSIRFDWDDELGKYSFYLSPEVPYIVGANAQGVLDRLLEGTGLSGDDITHWVLHSGGKKVIDSVCVNLGLSRHDVRHSITTLRDYGNLSSGSFLFTYQRLQREQVCRPGEYGVMMAMGPGPTIEAALFRC